MLSAADPAYVTRQVQAKDAVSIEKGLKPCASRDAIVIGQAAQQPERRYGVEIVKGAPSCLRDLRGYRPGGQLRPSSHPEPPALDRRPRIGQRSRGEIGGLVVGNGHQGEPDRKRLILMPGQQVVGRLVAVARPVQIRRTNGGDKAAPAINHAGCTAREVNVDRTAQRCPGVTGADAGGGRVDTERIRGAIEGCQLSGRAVAGRHRGEHLQVTQLGRPGQQVGEQQDTQPGDVRSAHGFRDVRAHPQQTRAGGPDFNIRAGSSVQQAQHAPQANVTAPGDLKPCRKRLVEFRGKP
jgi:hypothetical protein